MNMLCLSSLLVVLSVCSGCSTWLSSSDGKLVRAVVDGNASEVRRLLNEGADPNMVLQESDVEGLFLYGDTQVVKSTPVLSLAVQAGEVAITELLLQAGANANATTGKGASPLYYAVQQSPHGSALTALLLSHGADPNYADPILKLVPLHRALLDGELATQLALFPVTDSKWIDMALVESTRQHAFGPLVSAVTDMFRRNELPASRDSLDAFPPLTRAVLLNDEEGAREVLRRVPASLDERDRYGFTPLMWAVSRFGNADLAAVLLTAGADPNLTGDGGWTALFAAVEAEYAKSVSMLCQRGARSSVSIQYGRERGTLLMLAAAWRRIDVLKALLECRGDPKQRVFEGRVGLLDFAVGNRTSDRDAIIDLVKQVAEDDSASSPADAAEPEK